MKGRPSPGPQPFSIAGTTHRDINTAVPAASADARAANTNSAKRAAKYVRPFCIFEFSNPGVAP